MEYANHLKEYAPAWSAERVEEEVARIRKAAGERNHNAEVYKFCYSAIDLTTLSCNDSVASVTEFARKAAEFYEKYPHIPNVASICIYRSSRPSVWPWTARRCVSRASAADSPHRRPTSK